MVDRVSPLAPLVRDANPLSRHLAAGERLFSRGDAVNSVHLVAGGVVRLVRTDVHGAEINLFRAAAGSIVAEASLFAKAYHCDAVAEVPADLLVTPRAVILEKLGGSAEVSLSLVRELAHEVQRLRARAGLQRLRSARDRVYAALVLEADGAADIALDRPWTLFASEIGLTHEAVYRALSALEASGRISREARHVRLFGREADT